MADNMNDRVVHNGDPLKLEASDASNPWMVDNVSVFLNYCCPECDFKAKNLKLFSIHAMKNHEEALVLFEEVLSDIEVKNDNSDTYKEDQMDIKTENEEIGLRTDLKSHEKQTDQVSDKSGMREHWVLLAPEQFGLTPLSGDRRGNMPPLLKKSGMPGESRGVLLENRIMSTSSRKRISQSCCVNTCMSTNLDKLKKNFYSIPSANRYRHSICIRIVRC